MLIVSKHESMLGIPKFNKVSNVAVGVYALKSNLLACYK